MSTPQFSRPGAIDLSALKRPASPSGGAPGAPGGPSGGAPAGAGSYSVVLDELNFQSEMEGAVDAPVVLVFYSPAQAPASAQLAVDLETLSDEFAGRFLLGKVDIDAAPQIAQALQIQQVPVVALVMRGQLAPLIQQTLPIDELRAMLTQVLQAAAAEGLTGRVEPRTSAPVEEDEDEDGADPRYVPAEDALAADDIDLAVAEYQKLVDDNPADAVAAGGLAMAQVLQRTATVDPAEARAAAAESPEDVAAQTLVADLDLLGGHVEDAFGRLVDLIRRSSEDDRDVARTHLLRLFAAVGTDDPRVLKGRQNLASALY